jgi:sulfite dehydrogenase (quinone) subunit SoeB
VHDPDSVVSRAIRDRAGYTLMPEWDTRPANHYLPRRRNDAVVHAEDLLRVDNPLKVDGKQPAAPPQGPGREDYAT